MMKLVEASKKEIEWAQNVAEFAKKHGDDLAAAEIASAITEYSTRKISVAVMGLNKRGKSTFCNALLGRKDDMLAPVDWEPATGVVSSFHNSAQECAIVHFEDGKNQEINYSQIRKYVLEKENPENKDHVEYVEIQGKFDLDDDIVLLDLPGDDSIHAYHSQIVYNYLPNADVVLFLSSATDPIHKSELDLLSKVAEADRKKIFFIINKVDDCDEDELEEAKAHDLEVLKNAGICYEKKLYCISALQMMEEGKEAYEFNELAGDIRSFLEENKLNLQRAGFRNIVCNAVSGLLEKLETYAEASKLSEAELKQKIEDLKAEYQHSKEMLEHGLADFSESWENMVAALEQQLPALEDETKSKVKNYIDAIPMMSLTQKNVQQLPARITEIMEQVLESPLAAVEQQVQANLEKLDQNVRKIDKYLADNAITVHRTSTLNNHAGSLIAGGTFISVGSALLSIATIPASWAGLTVCGFNVGSVLAAAGGVVTLPLTALAAPLLLGGSLFLGLPILGWVRGKKRQKNEIIESANNSIIKSFCTMRTTKLPMLRQQGEMLVIKLKDSFTTKMQQTQEGLNQALREKTHLLGNSEIEKSGADIHYLADLLAEK